MTRSPALRDDEVTQLDRHGALRDSPSFPKQLLVRSGSKKSTQRERGVGTRVAERHCGCRPRRCAHPPRLVFAQSWKSSSLQQPLHTRMFCSRPHRLKPLALLALFAGLSLGSIFAQSAPAAAPATPKEPTIEQRIADLEAYVNNGARTPDVASKVAVPGPGHNAWLMTSSALVLFMTLPGLALFYGGLVRRKNVLSVLAQCMGIAGLVTILWWAAGYSLAFSGGNAIIGDLGAKFLNGVEPGKTGAGYHWISDAMWAMFQLSFAIITPALIVGAIAERMKFISVLVFVAIWMFVVYFPFAHMVWATNGLMCGPLNKDAAVKAIDFAGGTVVHMTSGWSALVLCMILGKRVGFNKE